MTGLRVGCYNDSLNTDGPQQFANWLGAVPDLDLLFTGQADDSDYKGSVNYAIGLQRWAGIKIISMPLMYSGITLQDCINGAMDADWLADAETMLSDLADQPEIIVRGPWEFNGNWEIWQAPVGQEKTLWVPAYQRWADTIRKPDSKGQFKLVWNWNLGWNDPSPCYPGDKYCDYMGPDIYWNPGEPTDFASLMLNAQYGLAWGKTFSAAHGGQPLCIPELGLGSNDLAQCTTDLFAWAAAPENNVAFINLWNSAVAYGPGGQLSAGVFPATGAAFKAAVLAIFNARMAAAPPAPIVVTSPVVTAPVAAAPTVTIGVDALNTMTLSFSETVTFQAGVPQTFTAPDPVAAPPAAVPVIINLSADEYQGNALASIVVDPGSSAQVNVAGSLAVTAVHGKATQAVSLGSFAPGSKHSALITFLNDDFAGTAATDRNLYLDSYQIGTAQVSADEQGMMSTGSNYLLTFTIPTS